MVEQRSPKPSVGVRVPYSLLKDPQTFRIGLADFSQIKEGIRYG